MFAPCHSHCSLDSKQTSYIKYVELRNKLNSFQYYMNFVFIHRGFVFISHQRQRYIVQNTFLTLKIASKYKWRYSKHVYIYQIIEMSGFGTVPSETGVTIQWKNVMGASGTNTFFVASDGCWRLGKVRATWKSPWRHKKAKWVNEKRLFRPRRPLVWALIRARNLNV